MGLNYYDSNEDDINAARGLGNTLSSLGYALPQLAYQKQQMQRQAVMDKAKQILLNAQVKETENQALYNQAHAGTEMERQNSEVANRNAANELQTLMGLRGMVQQQAPGVNNPLLGQLIDQARGQGLLPNEGMEMDRGSLVNTLSSLISARASRNAASDPSSAATLMTPHNLPPGGTGVNAFGATGVVGQPQQYTLGANQVRMQGDETLGYGPTVLGRGQNMFLPGQYDEPTAQGQPIPDMSEKQNLGGLGIALFNALPFAEQRKVSSALFPQVGAKLGFTNSPSMTSPQQSKTIVDPKTGKKWMYLGNMSDPTQDANEANWKETQ